MLKKLSGIILGARDFKHFFKIRLWMRVRMSCFEAQVSRFLSKPHTRSNAQGRVLPIILLNTMTLQLDQLYEHRYRE